MRSPERDLVRNAEAAEPHRGSNQTPKKWLELLMCSVDEATVDVKRACINGGRSDDEYTTAAADSPSE
jgi:hypothetical protein